MLGAVLHPHRHWRFIVPFAVTTAALIATDKYVAERIGENPPGTTYDVFKRTSDLGLAEVTYGVAGGMYIAGRLVKNERMKKTALLAAESYINSEIVKQTMKAVTRRARPAEADGRLLDGGRGKFWVGGISFPAGHSMNAWSLAAVLSEQYPDKPIIRYIAYGTAAATSAARIGARAHHPSDIVVGSVLGYLIGKYVARTHR